MDVGIRRTIVVGIIASSVLLVGVGAGCGSGDAEPTSTGLTVTESSAVSTTTTTTMTNVPSTSATVATTATTRTETTTARPTGLPTLDEIVGYEQWLKMNVEPVQGRTHGLTDIFINQERQTIAPNQALVFPFPDGTVIVKTQVRGSLIAIMRKVQGFDPEHGDWQWIEYGTDGRIVGKDASCWGCHAQAESTDWVFTELETP